MAKGLKDPTYWIGHIFTVVATIIGVYLAATVGFDKALELEIVRADRGTYYLSESLYSEVASNIEIVQGYIDKVGDNPFPYSEDFEGIAINTFILDSAKFNDSALEIEPTILQDVSRYYFEVGVAIDTYYATGEQNPSDLLATLKTSQQNVQDTQVLIRFADYKEAMRKSVESRGVDLSQPDW